MDKLKELVIHIAQSLVDFPEQVEVKEVTGEQTAVLELKVAQEDLGKIQPRRYGRYSVLQLQS
jgi:predicted RNA-binding protein YlqC (UPF0109 family)